MLKLDPTGQTLLYATYLGGTLGATPANITVDSNGSAFVSGDTHSHDFPLVNPAVTDSSAVANQFVGFIAKLAPAGNSLVFSSYARDIFGRFGTTPAVAVSDASASTIVPCRCSAAP